MDKQETHRTPHFGGFSYSNERRCLVAPDGAEVTLRAQSFAVFEYLANRPDKVVSKNELFAAIWSHVSVTDDSLVQCVADIRRALGDTERSVLRTIPRQGYLLVSDAPDSAHPASPVLPDIRTRQIRPNQWPIFATLGITVILATALLFRWSDFSSATALPSTPEIKSGSVTVSINSEASENSVPLTNLQDIVHELRIALGRYKTVKIIDNGKAQFNLSIRLASDGKQSDRLLVQARDNANASILFTRGFDIGSKPGDTRQAITRIAAFASPGGGSLWRHLINQSRSKPVEQLSDAECYALGYGCTKCSGKLDTISNRAKACLQNILDKKPDDVTAWALKSTLHAHQYGWASALDEPERSNLQARRPRVNMAIEAANHAMSLSDGNESVVHWATAQAYAVSCDIDKLRVAVKRGLEVNPDDPSLLATFGNWLAYNGDWDAGVAMIERAIAIEPQNYRRWWYYGPAMRYYARGEYQKAYDTFMLSFDEGNWLSHLQLAFTLPKLGRHQEARAAVRKLEFAQPGITIEKGLQIHIAYCVDDRIVQSIKESLISAGLPSRGDSSDLSKVTTPPVRIKNINGIPIEYLDMGEGEPVLFVHGANSDYRAWGYYEVPISENFRFISMTLRYFGSQPWPEPFVQPSIEDYVADLAAFIESLNAGPVHLVSWSLGGRIAGLLSRERPDLVKSALHYEPVENTLIADDTPSLTANAAVMKTFVPMAERLKAGDFDGSMKRFIEAVFEMGTGDFVNEKTGIKRILLDNAKTLSFLFNPKMNAAKMTCDYLGKVKVPTLIMHGEHTNKAWVGMARNMAKCIPGARLAVLPGVKHDGPIRSVAEFNRMITAFVREHS